MNLTELYKELYLVCRSVNDLIAEEGNIEKRFAKVETFLRHNQSEIEKYGLIPDITKMFQRNEFSIAQIEKLISEKREEEAVELRREQEERRQREEEARRHRELEEKKLKRKKALIKWGVIIVIIVLVAILTYGIVVIVAGIILYKFPNLRKGIAEYIADDWIIITGQ